MDFSRGKVNFAGILDFPEQPWGTPQPPPGGPGGPNFGGILGVPGL